MTEVAAVRAYLRRHQDRPPTREAVGNLAYQLYVVLLFGGFWSVVLARALELRAGTVALPASQQPLVGAVAGVVAVAVTFAGVRLGSWAGPVLVSQPTAAWLLPAPLDRRGLLQPLLFVGLGLAAGGGALLGVVAGAVAALATSVSPARALVGGTVAWAALATVTAVGALAAERSPALARTALRAGAVGVGVAGVVAAVAWQAPGVAVVVPLWGWALAPLAPGSGAVVWTAVGLLVAVAVAAVRWARGAVATIPDEELHRRAGVATAVRASATMFDFRQVGEVRRAGQRPLSLGRTATLPRPRVRWLATPWRDAVTLLRRRGVLARTPVVVAAAAVVLGRWPDAPVAVLVATLLVYAGASDLTEGLRTERAVPGAAGLLPESPRALALGHLVTPTVGLSAVGWIATVAAAPWAGARVVAVAAVGVPVLAAALVGAAAVAATRGAPPLHWIVMGDVGLVQLVGWVLVGPILAIAVVLGPLALVAAEVAAGAAVADLVLLLGYGVGAAVALATVVAYRVEQP